MLILSFLLTLLTAVHGSKKSHSDPPVKSSGGSYNLRYKGKHRYSAAGQRSLADENQFDGKRRDRSFLQQTGIVLDGDVSEWPLLHRAYPKIWELPTIDPNFEIFGMHDKAAATYYFAIKRTDADTIAAATTIYLDTDQSTSSATTHGLSESEYYIDFVNDATGVPAPNLYISNPWEWKGTLQHSFSADKKTVEIAVPEAMIGGATVGDIDFFIDVNDAKNFPTFFGAAWYTATSYDLPLRTADSTRKRVAIIFSPESEKELFGGGKVNEYIYGQLYTSIQYQCMMAGLPFDLIYVNELKDLTNIVNYDALVFPYNAFVLESDYDIVLHNLRLAVHHYGIGVVTGDNFMSDLAGDNANVTLENPYQAMWEIFGLTIGGYGAGNLTITALDPTHPIMTNYTAGEKLLEYMPGFFNHYRRIAVQGLFESSSNVTALAKTNNLHDAILAVETAGEARLVHFATCSIMADGSLMWQALRWVVFGDANTVGLQISRQKSVFSARNDMDQSRFPYDFERVTKALYEQYLVSWHQMYGFVGTDYINIGNNPAEGEYTNWTVSGPMYKKYMALGEEIGSHSYTHPYNISGLSLAELTFEFEGSGQVISQELGLDLAKLGYAQPGNPEDLRTVMLLDDMGLYYLTGTYTGKGIGFPCTFGFLSPDAKMAFMAPNMYSDFNLMGWKALTPTQALAVWMEQYQEHTNHANTPILHFHWHDYAPMDYSDTLIGDTIAMAYTGGSEFITNLEMVERMKMMKSHELGVSESAGVVTATVSPGSGSSGTFGTLALDAGCSRTEVISSVDNWYAYNDKKVFLPSDGGTFVIRKGASPNAKKTRISSLPMRAELKSVSGDGIVLMFQFVGSGTVEIELNEEFAQILVAVGATSTEKIGTTMKMTFNSSNPVKTGYITMM